MEEAERQIAAARDEVHAWLQERQPGSYGSNTELVDGFTRFVAMVTTLELRTNRNPSAYVHEARWYNAGREMEEFRKPFCAESATDARLLACAALIRSDAF